MPKTSTVSRPTTPPRPVSVRRRASVRRRSGLSKRRRTRTSSRQRTQKQLTDAVQNKTVPALLVGVLQDTRVSLPQFRRLVMCAGAKPSDLFDVHTGRPFKTKTEILMQLIQHNREATYVPKLMRRASHWLSQATVRVSDILTVIAGASGLGVSVDAVQQAIARNVHTSATSALPTPDGIVHTGIAQMPKVVAIVAALYLILRGVYAHRHSRRHNILTKLLTNTATPPDKPFQRACALSPRVRDRTYANTQHCLQSSYDTRLDPLMREHTTLPALRKALLGLRKPEFFGGRTLLNLHLVRKDGQIRESAAEVAYALSTEYRPMEVFDAAISYSAAVMGGVMKGMVG